MITTIYGSTSCEHCKEACKKYPDAKFINVRDLSHEEKVELRDRIIDQIKTLSVQYPILEDDKGVLTI